MIRRRSKPRPGRLKGKKLEQLRLDCFRRDGFRCVKCGEHVNWDEGEMSHIRNKRMWGDNLENVETSCQRCHKKYHHYGPSMTKPCPPKCVTGVNMAGSTE